MVKYVLQSTVIKNMRRCGAILAALYVVFMVYTLELYIWGENGRLAYKDMLRYRNTLNANVSALQDVHIQLKDEFEDLKKSPEKIELYARKQGYFSSGEHRVIVENMDLQGSYYVVGELVKPYQRPTIDVAIFRLIAFVFGLSSYIALRFSRKFS